TVPGSIGVGFEPHFEDPTGIGPRPLVPAPVDLDGVSTAVVRVVDFSVLDQKHATVPGAQYRMAEEAIRSIRNPTAHRIAYDLGDEEALPGAGPARGHDPAFRFDFLLGPESSCGSFERVER